MRFVILYRGREFEDNELAAAQTAGFVCIRDRTDIKSGDLVVPRYSALPYFEELVRDVARIGATLINDKQQHEYLADARAWSADLGGIDAVDLGGIRPGTV
jgi:hypothetical protein